MDIKDRIEKIREEIELARIRSITGEDVKLIAVSKYHPIEKIEQASKFGITDFGENNAIELKNKFFTLNKNINYHMIGNLQSNKVKYIYDKVSLIQSLDRDSLLKEINKRASSDGLIINCLVEVNIAGESQKGGVKYNKVNEFIEKCLDYKNIKICGLMTVAPNTDDEKFLRNCFRNMFKLKEDIIKKNYKNIEMKYLSMGMSGDFQIAIEEGSNMVRIGTKIFGKREY